ncbi:hypothetical protein C1G86_1414 [Dehalococcoides mccartyi]|uniref:Uncharacterized protein n=1 Tax=Dehalococcoides mccartyi TaxID=61435 RepID=A0A328EN78_9CHLR|nr:hypothetical protein C1G86_1414 [Dehalococcoides mccartyi]
MWFGKIDGIHHFLIFYSLIRKVFGITANRIKIGIRVVLSRE